MSNKTALITGSTAGIGKATALELAKKGYSVHILGTNKSKGRKVLTEVKEIFPEGLHELFIVDLSKVKTVNTFLNEYEQKYSTLEVLVLNAGIFPKQKSLSEDGIDLSFSVGYISRYLFAVKLNKFLAASTIGKVVHINGSVVGNIKYSQLKAPKYNNMTAVWQNSVGSALLVHNWQNITKTNVAHMHWNPGIVNTNTVKSQGAVVRYLSKLMGMIEPEQAGLMLAEHIETVPKSKMTGKFYAKGKLQKTKSKILNSQVMLNELLQFSKEFTGLSV